MPRGSSTLAINRTFFFTHVRQHLFGGALSQTQVAGMTAILDFWEAKYAASDDRWLAYLLGTTYHETDRKMKAIHEYGGPSYFEKRYGPPPTGQNPALARSLGNVHTGDGARFHGRGFVQLTGRANYTNWSKRLAIDLVANPDRALETPISTRILVVGCILGTFTGKKLADYLNPAKDDWLGARRVVNGQDKAAIIAGFAKGFYGGVSYTR